MLKIERNICTYTYIFTDILNIYLMRNFFFVCMYTCIFTLYTYRGYRYTGETYSFSLNLSFYISLFLSLISKSNEFVAFSQICLKNSIKIYFNGNIFHGRKCGKYWKIKHRINMVLTDRKWQQSGQTVIWSSKMCDPFTVFWSKYIGCSACVLIWTRELRKTVKREVHGWLYSLSSSFIWWLQANSLATSAKGIVSRLPILDPR